jgi:hypothetical protein
MLYPDHETRRLLVGEHQAELRRMAQQPLRDAEHDRSLTTVVQSRRHTLGWLRWRRRRAHRHVAPAA